MEFLSTVCKIIIHRERSGLSERQSSIDYVCFHRLRKYFWLSGKRDDVKDTKMLESVSDK